VLDHDRSLECLDGWDPASTRTGRFSAIARSPATRVELSRASWRMQMSPDIRARVICNVAAAAKRGLLRSFTQIAKTQQHERRRISFRPHHRRSP
jgi:hypothetical protein